MRERVIIFAFIFLALASLTARAQSDGDPRLTIASPHAGDMVKPGDTVIVTVAVDGPKLTGYSVSVPGVAVLPGSDYSGYVYTARLTVPNLAGDLVLVPQGLTGDNIPIVGPAVKIRVKPASSLVGIKLSPAALAFTRIGQTLQLAATTSYGDGLTLESSAGSTGTLYQSTNNGIVTVDANGLATATGVGAAVVTARNGTVSAQAAITVTDATKATPPENVSASVTMETGPLAIDQSGYFNQTIAIVNRSNGPLIGPLALVAMELPDKVTLMSAGRTVAMQPAGSQYVLLPLANGLSLPSNGRIDLQLSFIADRRRDIHFTPVLYRSTVP